MKTYLQLCQLLTVASLKQKMVVLKFQLEKLYTNNKHDIVLANFSMDDNVL